MKIEVKSLEETKKLAKVFASCLDENGLFVTLTGDIGAGKTQFVRYILEELEVKEKITSPSFVILNEYKSKLCPIYHFDLYRLEKNGLKSIVSELREYSKKGVLTFVEWAQFGLDEIPPNALKINVEYDEDNLDIRYYDFILEDKILNFWNKFTKRIEKWTFLPFAQL